MLEGIGLMNKTNFVRGGITICVKIGGHNFIKYLEITEDNNECMQLFATIVLSEPVQWPMVMSCSCTLWLGQIDLEHKSSHS